MRCEHWGWQIIVASMSLLPGEEGQNYVMMKCSGCGSFRCLDFPPGSFLT